MKNEHDTNDTYPPYMDLKMAARYLTISIRHMHRLAAIGQIARKRLSPGCVRYRKSDLDAFMNKK